MKKVAMITVLRVIDYDGDTAVTEDEPLFMQLVEGYPSFDDVCEFEEVVELVEGASKGTELQVLIDYMEYVHGEEDSSETLRVKENLLNKLFGDLDYYLDNDLLEVLDSDEYIITVEESGNDANELIELDSFIAQE